MYYLKNLLFIGFACYSFLAPSGSGLTWPIEVVDIHQSDINSIQFSGNGDYFFTADGTYVRRWSLSGESLDMNDNFIQEFNKLEACNAKQNYPILARKKDLFIKAIEIEPCFGDKGEDATEWQEDDKLIHDMKRRVVHVCAINPETSSLEVLIELYVGESYFPKSRCGAFGPNGHMVISSGQNFVIWQWHFNRTPNGMLTLREIN